MTTQRNDAHLPSKLVPADYTHVMSFVYPSEGLPFGFGVVQLNALKASAPFFRKPSGKSGCAICGAHYLSGDVFFHAPTGQHIEVGWECGDKLNAHIDRSETVQGAQRGKQENLLRLERERRKEEAEQFCLANEGLKEALLLDHPITKDLAASLAKWGCLSEKQVALALKLVKDAATPPKAKADVPEGKQTLVGKLIKIKYVDSNFGVSVKMLVEVETSTGFFRIYGTKPSALPSSTPAGTMLSFTAAVDRSEDDPSFGFFARPTKLVVLTATPS
jgi:hypothetical protein